MQGRSMTRLPRNPAILTWIAIYRVSDAVTMCDCAPTKEDSIG